MFDFGSVAHEVIMMSNFYIYWFLVYDVV